LFADRLGVQGLRGDKSLGIQRMGSQSIGMEIVNSGQITDYTHN